MKRILSLVLAMVMVLGSFGAVFAEDTTLAEEAVEILMDLGVLTEGKLEQDLKRQDAIVLLSRLFGDEATAKDFPAEDLTFEDIADPFYEGYIAWAVAQELTEGKSETKFGFDDKLKTQELAMFLLRALGYGDVDYDDALAKAKKLGLLVNVADAKIVLRGDMALMTLNALVTPMKDSEITLAEHLELVMPEEEVEVVEDATKIESVTASNLIEVVIQFDGKVDPSTSQDESNYLITGKTVTSASLSDDETSVTLTVSAALGNQTLHRLSFNNVRSGAKVLSTTNFGFTPIDAQLPEAVSVVALGNKTVKVTFSEPIVSPTTASFLIDGKAVLGYVNTIGRTVTVRLYSPLANEEHTINIKNVADFSGLKSLSKDMTFVVVEDTDAPAIAEVVKATFENVILRFSEPVDPNTVLGSNVYWLQGTTKKAAAYNAVRLSDDTYLFDFAGSSNMIQYATEIYVTGVKDYSGNTIAADTRVLVTPVLDTDRPEVISTSLESLSEITVKFTKTLEPTSAGKSTNYVIKDSNGKEVSKLKNITVAGKVVEINLTQAIAEGKTYTLEISGVSDNTVLKNVMMPYSVELSTDDETAPTVVEMKYNTDNNSVIVTFSEAMMVSGDGSIVEPSKFLYSLDGTTWKSLPGSALINVSADSKSVIIIFPSSIAVNTINSFRVQLVKDMADNYLAGLSVQDTLAASANPTFSGDARAVARNKINVTFDQNLQANTVSTNDFEVTGGVNVVSAELSAANPKVVVLTLDDNTKLNEEAKYGTTPAGVKVTVKANATTSTADGKNILAGTTTNDVTDGIKATVSSIAGSADGKTILVTFNEPVVSSSDLANDKTDFVVRLKNGAITTDYSVGFGPGTNQITITFTNALDGVMSVEIANPRFIKDGNSNIVAAQDAISVQVDNAAPTFTPAATYASDVITVTASEDLKEITAANLKVEGSVLGTFADSVVLVAETDYTATNVADAEVILVTLTAAGKAKVTPAATTKFKVTGLATVKDLAGHSISPTVNFAVVDITTY